MRPPPLPVGHLLLAIAVSANLHEDSLRFCELYTECTAVARLEERLCVGNSRHRPYWLPSYHDPLACHGKLKNDYKMLDHLEIEQEKKYVACLIEKTQPLTEDEAREGRCDYRAMQNAPRFSFARTITYVPTNCFTGMERRLEKECGRLKGCCPAVNKCSSILESSEEVATMKEVRVELWKRAKGCERGESISPLPIAPEIAAQTDDEHLSWSPSGNISFRVRDEETVKREEEEQRKQRRGQADEGRDKGTGTIRINIIEEEKWRKAQKLAAQTFGSVSNTFDIDHKGMRKAIRDPVPSGGFPIDKEEKPRLVFPEDPVEVTSRLPVSLEEHNKAFHRALVNDNKIKAKIAELERKSAGEEAEEALDSLLDASAAASGASTGEETKDIDKGPFSRDEAVTVKGDVVTTGPIIFTKGEDGKGCRPKKTSKILAFDRVMAELGEDADSESMKNLKQILDSFETDVRAKLVEAKGQTEDKKVLEVLESLIANFDTAHARLLMANSTFAPADYPEDDAEIAGTICEPLSKEDENALEELPKDEHNDPVLLEVGNDKLVISGGNLALEEKPSHEKAKGISSSEYKEELEDFKRVHHIDGTTQSERNETACDMYMRCRNQMHLALDGCAWRFAASRVLPTLAESSESLLYRGDDLCDPSDRPLYEDLYTLVVKRNGKLKNCLTEKNRAFFESSVCLPFPVSIGLEYNAAMLRVLSANYSTSTQCFHDANLIQEKCTKLRLCCPNFDSCRDETLDIAEEQAIISQTAKVNDHKQECLRKKATEQFHVSLRELLGKGGPDVLRKIKNKGFLSKRA